MRRTINDWCQVKNIVPITCFSLMVLGMQVGAQTRCPMGAQAGSIQCLPDQPQGGGSAPQPTGRWHKTWGAIANNEGGDVGFAMGRLSKEDAEAIAVKRCEGFNSGRCKVIFVIHNQCVASATPPSGPGWITTSDSKERASDRVMEMCERKSGKSCRMVLAECSDPIFEKF